MGKFVLFLLIPCLSFCTWQTQAIDTDGDVGAYSSIAVDAQGLPQISYTNLTFGRLKHAFCGTDSTWNIKSLGTTTTGGYYSSIALNDGKTHIAHYNANQETLLYTEIEISGTLIIGTQTYYGTYTYLTKTVDTDKVGKFCDIAIDTDGDPQISYYNEKKKALNYAFWTGTAWATSTIDCATTGDRGRFTSLFLAEDSLPIISYYDAVAGDLRLAFWNMTAWGSGTLDSIGDVGRYSSIAGTNSVLYIAYYDATNGNLKYATNPESMLKWRYHTGGDVNSSPAIGVDGTIYVGSDDGYLYAIKYDGSFKWRYPTGSAIDSSPTIAPDGTIYVGSNDKKLYAINPDGSFKWSYLTGGVVNSSPAIGTTGVIYVGSDDGKLYLLNPDGTLKGSYTTGNSVDSSPAIGADGTIYFGCDDKYLYALNSNGSLTWSYLTGGAINSSPAIGADGTIYFGCDDKYLYALNKNGTLKWKYPTGGVINSSPTIGADGVIYVGSNDNYLYALKSDGNIRWKYSAGCIDSSPVIGADGVIYFGSDDEHIYSLYPNNGAWTTSVIDSVGDVGKYCALALTPTGIPYISYYDATNQNLKIAWWAGGGWGSETIDSVGNVGMYSTIAVDNDIVHISYYDETNGDLKYATNGTVTPPNAPTGLSATAISSSTINLAWTDNSSNESWFIIERGSTITTFVQIGTTTLAAYTNTGLASNTTYYYRVMAYNTLGTSAYSNIASATTWSLPPNAPSSLMATATSSSMIDLSWSDNSTDETGFVVERGTNGTTFTQIGITTLATYTDTGLMASTTYYYRVAAFSSNGTSAYSNVASTATLSSIPLAPSNLIATAISNSQIRLNWTDNSTNETGFVIERLNGTFTYIATVSSNIVEWTDSPLAPNTTYYYRVAAFNLLGTSAYSNIASATTGATQLSIWPSYTLIGSGSTSTVTINIDNVSNMSGASVYLSFDPSIISVATITQGPFPSGGMLLSDTINNGSGTLIYSVVLVSGSATGSGVLATITLTGVSTGTSPLSFLVSTTTTKKTHLIDNSGLEIPFGYTNGTVSCSVMGSITGKVVSSVCGTTFMEFAGITVKIGSYTTSTNGSSTFNFSAIPAGSHTLWADTTGAGYASQTVYISGGDQDLGTFTMLAADTDDSGQVNLTDFWKFRQSYGSPTPEVEADFDHNLDCDMQDFFILRSNFGKTRSLAKSKANGKTILYIEPQIGRAKLGDEIAIDLKIADVSGLIGVSLILNFSSELNLISLSKGGFVNSFAVLREQKENGRIIYDLGLLQGEVSGSGTILSVKFLAGKAGSATISVGESKLMASDGKWMSFGSQSASIKIEETCASLWIEPKNIEVFKEGTFTSQVFINVQSLIGARVKVKYLSNLSLLDVGQGAFQTTVFLSATSTDAVEVILANVDGISGSGSLFSLRFLAKELGTGAITFELADLRNKENEQISVSILGAEVSVKKRLTCDFNQNNEIDFEDLLSLIGSWKKPSPVYDIGPASGMPPDLISNPDGVVDFEDLMVFCLMWKWDKKMQNVKCKMQNSFIWMEEEGDWVVVKYKGIDEALGGRYVLRFDRGVEIEKIEGRLKAFVWERSGNDRILEFGFIDAPPEGEVCRIQIKRKDGMKIQGEGEIRDKENKKILLESSSLFLETLSLSDSICYPNPSRIGVVNFYVPPDTSIQIYNIAGELIEKLDDKNPTWPTKNIASGTYIYILTCGKDKKTRKVGVVR